MLKFGSELRYGIRSPNVRTPVDIPSILQDMFDPKINQTWLFFDRSLVPFCYRSIPIYCHTPSWTFEADVLSKRKWLKIKEKTVKVKGIQLGQIKDDGLKIVKTSVKSG